MRRPNKRRWRGSVNPTSPVSKEWSDEGGRERYCYVRRILIVLLRRYIPIPVVVVYPLVNVMGLDPILSRLTPICSCDGVEVARDDGEGVLNGIVPADEPNGEGESSREDEDEEGEEGDENGGDGSRDESRLPGYNYLCCFYDGASLGPA